MPRQPAPWRRKAKGNAWYAQVNGRQVRLAGPDATKGEAQAELYRLLTGHEPAGSGLSVRDILNLYLAHVVAAVGRGDLSPRTQADYERYLSFAAEALGHRPAAALRNHHVAAWLDTRPTWNSTTRYNTITALKSAFRWAKRMGHLAENPLADMPRPRPQRREAIPSAVQVRALIDSGQDQQWRDLVTAIVETGCRPSEVLTLEATGVDLESGTWSVVNKTRHRTGNKVRTVYLTPKLVEMSRRLVDAHPEGPIFRNCRGRPWTLSAINCRIWRRRRGVIQGMGDVTIGHESTAYALRHLYVTDALERNVPVATLAELVGHRDMNMIMRVYSKLAERTAHLRDAAAKVRPSDETESARSGPGSAPGGGGSPGAV